MAVLEEQAMTLVNAVQQHLDRVVSPSTRREAWERTSELAARRPGAFTFLTLLTALTVPPVLLFATFALSTLLFGLGAAVLFALFWIGIALFFFLLPTLFFAAGCAVFLWTWAVGSFLVARWLSRRTGFDFGFGLFGDGDGEGIGGDKGRLSVREKGGDGDQEVMLKANGEREKGEMKDPADGQVWAYKGPPREERNGIKMEEM